MKFDIPEGTAPATCRGCNATIYWVKTPSDKNMPVDPDGKAHWGTCPNADQFGKNKKSSSPPATITPEEASRLSLLRSELASVMRSASVQEILSLLADLYREDADRLRKRLGLIPQNVDQVIADLGLKASQLQNFANEIVEKYPDQD